MICLHKMQEMIAFPSMLTMTVIYAVETTNQITCDVIDIPDLPT